MAGWIAEERMKKLEMVLEMLRDIFAAVGMVTVGTLIALEIRRWWKKKAGEP